MFVGEKALRPCRIEEELSARIDTLAHDAGSLTDILIDLGCQLEVGRRAKHLGRR
jgi:hypothetical protein